MTAAQEAIEDAEYHWQMMVVALKGGLGHASALREALRTAQADPLAVAAAVPEQLRLGEVR